MYARKVEQAAARLHELRQEEWADLGLATLAFGLAVAATRVRPALAVPLLLGGLAAAVLAARAFWRRWDLLDRLVLDRDAYTIHEVRAYAARAATMDRRRGFAVSVRSMLKEPEPALAERVAAAAEELDALASELDDDELELEPASAVACERFLTERGESPLFNPVLPAEDVRSRVHQIRSGFERRRLAA